MEPHLIPISYPAGVRPPLTADNANDHSGLIVVLTSFYLVLILAAVSARVFSLYRKRLVQADDYVFGVLVVIACAQASVVLEQVHLGWGKRFGPDSDETPEEWMAMLKAGYAADILSIIALGLSKISTCLFYEALFSQLHRGVIRTILGASMIWTVLSIILVAVRCTGRPWVDIGDECRSLFPRWQAITALDITTEALLVLYSAWAIHNVRIPLKKQLIVFLALGCRIVLIPLSSLRLHYVHTQLNSPTPILHGAYTTTATEIYLSLSIICQVTSSMKFILAVYEDKNGFSYTDRSGSARSTGNSNSNSKTKTAVSSDPDGRSRSYSLNLNMGLGFGVRRDVLGGGAGVEAEAPDKIRFVSDRADSGGGIEEESRRQSQVNGPGQGQGPSGLRILREVQWTVEDEAIELDERRPPVQTRPIYQSLRY